MYIGQWQQFACRVSLGLVMAAGLSGCGLSIQQKTALNQFASATHDFSRIAQTELQQSRHDVIEMNRYRFELGDPRVKLTEFDQLLTRDRAEIRVRALQALEDYAVLLRKLMAAVPEEELLEASNSLVMNLRAIKGVSFSDDRAEGIGKAVAAVGGLYVERKRAVAVREIVDLANEPIVTVIDLVKRDFDPAALGWNAGYKLMASELDGRATKVGVSVPMDDLTARQSILRAQALAAENTARFELVSAEIVRLASAVADAQKNLRLVLSSSNLHTGDIDQLATRVREFKSVYSMLRH
jgi:hypothetical protein